MARKLKLSADITAITKRRQQRQHHRVAMTTERNSNLGKENDVQYQCHLKSNLSKTSWTQLVSIHCGIVGYRTRFMKSLKSSQTIIVLLLHFIATGQCFWRDQELLRSQRLQCNLDVDCDMGKSLTIRKILLLQSIRQWGMKIWRTVFFFLLLEKKLVDKWTWKYIEFNNQWWQKLWLSDINYDYQI